MWECDQNFAFLVDPSVQKYDHAGSRNEVILCQTPLCSCPTAPFSPRLPGSCTWILQSPILGPTLNAQFDVSELLPGPFRLGWAPPGRGVPGGVSQADPGGFRGVESPGCRSTPVCQDVTISWTQRVLCDVKLLSGVICGRRWVTVCQVFVRVFLDGQSWGPP